MTAMEDVRSRLAAGQCRLAVCSEGAFEMAQSFGESDPMPDAAGRPIFFWDAQDGLSVVGATTTATEGMDDAMKALEFAGKLTGPGVFILDLDGAGVAEREAPFRSRLKSLGGHFTPAAKRALVLVSKDPLPESIAKLFSRVGYPEGAPARAAAPAAPPPGAAWRDIRQLETFDTPEWLDRMVGLTEEQCHEVISGEYYLPAVDRVNELRAALKRQFARKDEIIDLMTCATVGQVPMVLLGPPGTAKSHLVRAFCDGLGLGGTRRKTDGNGSADGKGKPTGGLFEYLLTRYTTPEEIFGPVHIPDLIERRIYRRVTAGRLPEAEMAFLDEIFKASSAIVNALLAILNERIFHNAELVQRVPLIMIFAASNEPPQDPQLAALYDRFPLRANCGRVEDEHLGELWQRSWELNYEKEFHPKGRSIPQVSCTNDFRLLHRVSMCQCGGRQIAETRASGHIDFNSEFMRVFKSLRRDYEISDRTLRALYGLARAMAIVERRTHLSVAELNVFRYISWDESGAGELTRLVNNLKRGASM